MDANEIVKHAPELLKSGAALAGALKFTHVVKAMLGPATAEIAERFRDEVRLYRFGRQLACLKKAEQMATDAGFAPQAVPIKLLFPLLEGASFEENEELHTMWAALLANASSPKNGRKIRPGFIAILKQMAADEAILFNWISTTEMKRTSMGQQQLALRDLLKAAPDLGFPNPLHETKLWVCLDALESALLIRRLPHVVRTKPSGSPSEDDYLFDKYDMTSLGREFVEACCPPEVIRKQRL